MGFSVVVEKLVTMLNTNTCIRGQVKAVNDIEDVVLEVKETGYPAIEFLKVNGMCTGCIWYNGSLIDGKQFQKVEIKFKTMVTHYSMNVSMPWGNVNINDDGGCESTKMRGGRSYSMEITPNYILCQDC